MNFDLTKEVMLIQKLAREFAQKTLEPIAKQIDEENHVPQDVLQEIAELGLLGITLPEEHGGAGAGFDQFVLALEQISKVSSGTGLIIAVHSMGTGVIVAFGNDEQKKRYLPAAASGSEIASFAFTEPGTGSDPKQISTTAAKDGDFYIINGTKRFISNPLQPGPMVVFARDDQSGDVSAFIVDKFCEGYSVSEPWHKTGYRGSKACDIYFKDVKVPAANLLGTPGKGFSILLHGIALGKIGTSTIALGGILGAFEEGVKYAREKLHRGTPIGSKFAHIQDKIAELGAIYNACSLLCYRLGATANNIAKNPFQLISEAAMVKFFLSDKVCEAARLSVDIHASYGVMRDYPVERIYRDAIIAPQIEGINDVQKVIYANSLLR